MFFFTDESGNTGNNLFDEAQPVLSYGVLSSVTNPDALCKKIHSRMLRRLGVDQLHANELRESGIAEIGDLLFLNQKRLQFDFDYYFVRKKDFAVVTFFDRVFDSYLNPAVPWTWYNTPLRYLIVVNLPNLFDDELLQRAWTTATTLDQDNAIRELKSILEELLERLGESGLDPRTVEIMTDAFNWGASNPKDLDYTISSRWQALYMSPNVVGFQFVLAAIARRVKAKRKRAPRSIVVDRQNQFNSIQKELQTHYAAISESIKSSPFPTRMFLDRDLNKEFASMPKDEFLVSSSKASIGLQIADMYLWIYNRLLNQGDIDDQLKPVVALLLRRSIADGISIDGLADRLHQFNTQSPSLEESDVEAAKKIYDEVEAARRESLARRAGVTA